MTRARNLSLETRLETTSPVSALLRTLVWVYNPPGKFAMARSQVEKARRRLWVALAVLPVLLIFGLWSTRGEALIPRLVGAGVNIFFTSWFIFLLRKTKRHDSTG
jgi:hypothetical protein